MTDSSHFDSLSVRQVRIKRLLYRASYTGMKQTDIVLGHFAQSHLPSLTDGQLDAFEALLAQGDYMIMAWVQGDEAVPERFQGDVLDMIKNFKNNK